LLGSLMHRYNLRIAACSIKTASLLSFWQILANWNIPPPKETNDSYVGGKLFLVIGVLRDDRFHKVQYLSVTIFRAPILSGPAGMAAAAAVTHRSSTLLL